MGNTESADDLGSWVCLYAIENGGWHRVMPDHWDELTAAYGAWYERRIDRVLTLVSLDGDECVMAASRIADLALSTAAGRVREREFKAAFKLEDGYASE